MSRKNIGKRIQRRKKWMFKLSIITIITIIILWKTHGASIGILRIIFEMSTMIVSALISTLLAIYMTKEDIMENDYAVKKDEFGVITFEAGYQDIFINNDCKVYLNSNNWEQFFKSSKDHKIFIVGIHLNDFFEKEKNRECLLKLCLENDYKVEIILGNPYSNEVIQQAIAEKRQNTDDLKNKVLSTYELFCKDIKNLDEQYRKSIYRQSTIIPSEKLKKFFKIVFSNTLPKALIFCSGDQMIISPYLFGDVQSMPTLIVENASAAAFYDNYEKYIKRLSEKACCFEELRKNVLPIEFFDQPYRKLSPDFYQDIKECKSLCILGLGQKHMFTQLEPEIIDIVKRGGKIEAILGDPEGDSTRMCVDRSLIHDDVGPARLEHKLAINSLLRIKKKQKSQDINVYIWDCFFPYTLYIFNKGTDKNIKIYIWFTNLFEEAEKRLGFSISQKDDSTLVKSYLSQYEAVLRKASEIQKEYRL